MSKIVFASNNAPKLILKTPKDMVDIQFENGVFPPAGQEVDEELIDWLQKACKSPAISRMVRVIDIEEQERIAKDFLAKQQVAVSGGVTSGNEQATLMAHMANVPNAGFKADAEPDADGDKNPDDKGDGEKTGGLKIGGK